MSNQLASVARRRGGYCVELGWKHYTDYGCDKKSVGGDPYKVINGERLN